MFIENFIKNNFAGLLTVPLSKACAVFEFNTKTARNQISAGTFPLPTLVQCGRRVVKVEEIINYYNSLRSDKEPASKVEKMKMMEIAPAKRARGRGRPPKNKNGGATK
ncbi:hypothetical protein [Sulfuriferula nivalis]|uniref:Pyocin activator protein PrtN n=1 Tax=Sulfuriferula nivalis TaxID=2675298 RepID=A0A809RFJ7_9PROT|nr:hypothetical protein [Sulfuriferula nivalis]BBP00365.1 hypothetical protein SFSGTM_10730 [Sulfuriferula nivalis]